MASHAAFLRGMNLGGRRITNYDLCGAFESLGLEDVSAFLASGNVAFSAKGTAAALTRRIEAGLEEALGYPVRTFVRSASQLRRIATTDPFVGRPGASSRGKMQVIFLQRPPTPAASKD